MKTSWHWILMISETLSAQTMQPCLIGLSEKVGYGQPLVEVVTHKLRTHRPSESNHLKWQIFRYRLSICIQRKTVQPYIHDVSISWMMQHAIFELLSMFAKRRLQRTDIMILSTNLCGSMCGLLSLLSIKLAHLENKSWHFSLMKENSGTLSLLFDWLPTCGAQVISVLLSQSEGLVFESFHSRSISLLHTPLQVTMCSPKQHSSSFFY